MVCSLIALGGNLGTSPTLFSQAMERLERPGISVLRLSRPLHSSPMGVAAGQEFLNAAALVDCQNSPIELLAALHSVEDLFGRTRDIRWGPRTLDLDLCLFGDETIDSPELVVPHPAMWYRHFVITPAVEIAPQLCHPLLNQTVEELHQQLTARPLDILLRDERTRPYETGSAELVSVLPMSSVVRWHLNTAVNATADSKRQIFAEVVLEEGHPDVVEESGLVRRQPSNERTRTIRVVVSRTDHGSQIHERLQEIVDATGGTSAVHGPLI